MKPMLIHTIEKIYASCILPLNQFGGKFYDTQIYLDCIFCTKYFLWISPPPQGLILQEPSLVPHCSLILTRFLPFLLLNMAGGVGGGGGNVVTSTIVNRIPNRQFLRSVIYMRLSNIRFWFKIQLPSNMTYLADPKTLLYGVHHRLNMELDLKSLFGLHVLSCTHWLRPRNSPLYTPHLGSYTRDLVSQDGRHLFVTP